MRTMSWRCMLLAVGLAGGLAGVARAHDDPAGCGGAGVALTLSLFRADGTTGLVGEASECERMAYRVTLRGAAPYGCAFSRGTLTLTTPDGVVHRIQDDVPPVGGTSGVPLLQSALIPYAVRTHDVKNGVIKAFARYEGGVFHDNPADTPGVSAWVDRTVGIIPCGDSDPCTYDRCDPTRAGVAACISEPLCDDDDPLTADTCKRGRCSFEPIASGGRPFCADRPARDYLALAPDAGVGAHASAHAHPHPHPRDHAHPHPHEQAHPHEHPHPHPHD